MFAVQLMRVKCICRRIDNNNDRNRRQQLQNAVDFARIEQHLD